LGPLYLILRFCDFIDTFPLFIYASMHKLFIYASKKISPFI